MTTIHSIKIESGGYCATICEIQIIDYIHGSL